MVGFLLAINNNKQTILCTHTKGNINRLSGYNKCKYYTSTKLNKVVLGCIIFVVLLYLVGVVSMVLTAVEKGVING